MKDTPIQLCPQLEFMFMKYYAPTDMNQALNFGGWRGKQGIGERGSEVFVKFHFFFLNIFFFFFFFFLGGGFRVDVNGEVRFL